MRRFFVLGCLMALVVAVLPAATAAADEPSSPSITVPVDTAVFGDPGSVHELASVPVDPGSQGSTCTATAIADNNPSVHPDSNLLVSSGESAVELPDVEASPNQVTNGSGTLVLGPELTVTLTLGPDGVFSGGIQVALACETPPPPTTRPPDPPPTSVPETPISVTATAIPPPSVPAVAVPSQPVTTG